VYVRGRGLIDRCRVVYETAVMGKMRGYHGAGMRV